MDFDISWLLLGAPVMFALGWLASRLDLRQMRIDNRQAPKAYFKGLNYLLNEQQDQAIDAFIEAVQRDPDTTELHFALGNLFRRRGEYQRAVRVHEHLLARADLPKDERDRAQHALAQDFLKAGLLDRAEQALQKLDGSRYQTEAWLTLLALYERGRDWPQASATARRLQQAGQANFESRLAHYQCELAAAALKKEDPAQAAALLHQALTEAPQAARPRIQLAGLQASQGHSAEALHTLMPLFEHAPQAVPLVASELVRLARESGQLPQAREALRQHNAANPSIDVADALVQADLAAGMPLEQARQGYVRHMQQEPSLIAATRWLSHEPSAKQDGPHAIAQRSLEHAARPLARYRCAACGFEAQGYFWQCPGCQTWDSLPPRRIEEL